MSDIKCYCGKVAEHGTVKKEGPSKGRNFLRCSKWPADGHCKFFQWICEVALVSPTPVAGVAPLPVLVETSSRDLGSHVDKLEWRVAILEDVIRRIGGECDLRRGAK